MQVFGPGDDERAPPAAGFLAVRVSAADALGAADQGRDADRAQAATDALSRAVYEHRRVR
ncbi:hypothetical protein [Streptomyces sp. NPDC102264]|uniref:hypothetical protein n=1 Tax=Streptomyces sp. NPDC102264 TaxID=3366149 RepID=UPI0038119C96